MSFIFIFFFWGGASGFLGFRDFQCVFVELFLFLWGFRVLGFRVYGVFASGLGTRASRV